jgi:hypothetical protein
VRGHRAECRPADRDDDSDPNARQGALDEAGVCEHGDVPPQRDPFDRHRRLTVRREREVADRQDRSVEENERTQDDGTEELPPDPVEPDSSRPETTVAAGIDGAPVVVVGAPFSIGTRPGTGVGVGPEGGPAIARLGLAIEVRGV